MPLPKPGDRENQGDYTARFMANEEARKTFPDPKQRLAVALAEWRREQRRRRRG